MEQYTDLTNCDREPIHIPGKIQSHGVLIAFDQQTTTATHVSDNVMQWFGASPDALFGASFSNALQTLGIDVSGLPFLNLQDINTVPAAENSVIVKTQQGKEFHFIIHNNGKFIGLELEPVLSDSNGDVQDIMGTMLNKILGAKSLKDTLSYCVKQVREIIGYDRVMIYRFAEDGHGEVVAEDLNDGMEPFFGLHYPASDIPKQARELYKKNLVRIIADVDSIDAHIEINDKTLIDQPLDLTDSVLRAVSPIHIQYLKNMGVKASFSVSLLSDGELWGLIACHNYEAKVIDFRKRNRCKIIGQLLSTSLVFRTEEENKEQRNNFNEHMLELVRLVRKDWDIPAVLINKEQSVLDISEASGAALLYENKIYTIGETPSNQQLTALSEWLKFYSKNQFFQTNNLLSVYADAYEFKNIASGLMSVALSRELNEYIFWFKKEIAQTIRWAGNPEKPVQPDPSGLLSLSPRNSFELFLEEKEGVSESWNSNEIGVAMKLREELVHIINERANQIRKLNEQLKQAYDELDTFSFTISHDLKTPLASIKNYAEILLENDDEFTENARPMLSKIVKSADKMNLLIREVLSYSRIGRLIVKPEPIDMGNMLGDIKEELMIAYKEHDPSFIIGNVLDIQGDPVMMYQVFSNVIGNAVKYSSQTKKPEIKIDSTTNGREITYSIADNGVGIDMKYGDQIFDLFKRMSNASTFEGTGVGLAIVKRILEKHQSRIWYESQPGNGTIFYLSIKIPVSNGTT